MKKVIILLIVNCININFSFGQAPKSFKYQAVVRDINGTVITKQNISLQISIIQDTSFGGTIVYSETFTNIKPTNLGMVNLDIGKGTIISGNFNTIDWGKHKFYISINMDPNGGSNYSAMGTNELLSVPYALYAETAGNSNLNLTGTGSTTITGTYPNYVINGKYQSLKESNDTIYLNNGGFVKLPYKSGTGIGFTGTIINNTMPNATHTGDAIGSDILTVIAIQGNPVSSIIPSTNQVLSWNGSAWTPIEQAYYAGTGLSLSGNTFINTSPNIIHSGDAIGSGALTVVALQGNSISTNSPAYGQILIWNGTNWAPSTISINTYYPGTGLSLTGNTFYQIAHTGDAIGQTNMTVVALQGEAISTITPNTNQVLSWNGSAWTPTTGGSGGIGGSGKINLVTFWTASNTIGSDTNLYWDNINKRLGIGTKSPRQSLEVSGNLTLPDLTWNGYIFRGNNTFIHNYGTMDMFAGLYAGNLNLTGTDNTGVGYGAIYSNSSGSNNSAFGSNALYYNTTGIQNVAIGSYTLYYNSAGKQNVAIGTQALYCNNGTAITGSYNTAIGYQALYSNTAKCNTATGCTALVNNATGQFNTANGYGALLDNYTGSYNTAMGDVASEQNSTGSYNSTLGYFAEMQGTSCSYTTAIGANTLPTNTTGSYNTALGYSADVNASNLTNVTVIGYNAIATASNQVMLGNSVITTLYCMGAYNANTANTANMYVSTTGQIMRSSSSMRYKENIQNITINTSRLYELRPVSYISKMDHEPYFGLIAEEVAEIYPELVEYAKARSVIPGSTSEELIPDAVKYPMLGVLILNEMKKMKQKVDSHDNNFIEMKQQIDELKIKNQQLENEIEQIKKILKK